MDFRRSRFRRPCRRFDAPLGLPVFPMIVQGGFGTAQAVRVMTLSCAPWRRLIFRA
jgi:hypothetical protein